MTWQDAQDTETDSVLRQGLTFRNCNNGPAKSPLVDVPQQKGDGIGRPTRGKSKLHLKDVGLTKEDSEYPDSFVEFVKVEQPCRTCLESQRKTLEQIRKTKQKQRKKQPRETSEYFQKGTSKGGVGSD